MIQTIASRPAVVLRGARCSAMADAAAAALVVLAASPAPARSGALAASVAAVFALADRLCGGTGGVA